MEHKEEPKILEIAKILAAVYWRGRLNDIPESDTLEAMIAAAAEKEASRWMGTAAFVLGVATEVRTETEPRNPDPVTEGVEGKNVRLFWFEHRFPNSDGRKEVNNP